MEATATIEKIRQYIGRLAAGEVFATRDVLGCGTRGAVDSALFELVKSRIILRLAWGIFVRNDPNMSEPTIEAVTRCKIRAFHRQVVEPDWQSARAHGLSSVEGPAHVYYTDGASSRFKAMGVMVTLVRRAARKLMLVSSASRKTIKAMWSFKKEGLSDEVFSRALRHLGSDLLPDFRNQRRWMPFWMSDLSYRLQI